MHEVPCLGGPRGAMYGEGEGKGEGMGRERRGEEEGGGVPVQ